MAHALYDISYIRNGAYQTRSFFAANEEEATAKAKQVIGDASITSIVKAAGTATYTIGKRKYTRFVGLYRSQERKNPQDALGWRPLS